MSNHSTVYVGLDVHKDFVIDRVRCRSSAGSACQRDLHRLCTRMQSKASHVQFVYEADGRLIRSHTSDNTVQRAFHLALIVANIHKHASVHTLRHYLSSRTM